LDRIYYNLLTQYFATFAQRWPAPYSNQEKEIRRPQRSMS